MASKIRWDGWHNLANVNSREFVCGFCGKSIGTSHGYYHNDNPTSKIYICTNCGNPTYIDTEVNQHPGPLVGREVENLPDNIKSVYWEIRDSAKNSNFTAASLLGRKLIMHIAVDKAGAEEGETFVDYIKHLKKSRYIPPNADKWLEYMKDLGNEANHEIKLGTQEEAEKILKFVELLLIFIYELPGEIETNASEDK